METISDEKRSPFASFASPFASSGSSGSGTRHPSHAQSRGGRSASRSVSSPSSRTPPSSPPFFLNFVWFFVPSAEVVLTMYRVTAERSAARGAGNGGAGSHATQTVRRKRSSESCGKYASKERSSSSRSGASGPPDASTRASPVGAAGGAADEGSNTPPTQPVPGVVDNKTTPPDVTLTNVTFFCVDGFPGGAYISQHAPFSRSASGSATLSFSSQAPRSPCAQALHPAVWAHARQHAAALGVRSAKRSAVPFGNASAVAPQKRSAGDAATSRDS